MQPSLKQRAADGEDAKQLAEELWEFFLTVR